jgi:hypothetical protein
VTCPPPPSLVPPSSHNLRTDEIEVAGHGTAYLKLWFSGVHSGQAQEVADVYLFLNDDTGHSEECFLFQIRATER